MALDLSGLIKGSYLSFLCTANTFRTRSGIEKGIIPHSPVALDSVFGFPGSASAKESIHLPVQEARAQSLGQEEPLEKQLATHSSILVWKIPWAEEPGGLQS